MSQAIFASESIGLTSLTIAQEGSVQATLPQRPLNNQSLQVSTLQDKIYFDWSNTHHCDSFTMMQNIITVWRQNNISTQYLVYGKVQPSSRSFQWEIVPHYEPSSFIGRFWQQLQILYKISFGAATRTIENASAQANFYKPMFFPNLPIHMEKVTKRNTDPFCNPTVIKKQTVLEGRRVNVLFSYTPIGLGGEKLHFLIIPKEHRATFADVTQEEYVESARLAEKLITAFSVLRPRQIESAYLFHKSGINAGQTVPHWHMHVVLTSNKVQDFFGKLTVFKNMLFGSSPMRDRELIPRVAELKKELERT